MSNFNVKFTGHLWPSFCTPLIFFLLLSCFLLVFLLSPLFFLNFIFILPHVSFSLVAFIVPLHPPHTFQGQSTGKDVFAAAAILTAPTFIRRLNTTSLWNPSCLFLWAQRGEHARGVEGCVVSVAGASVEWCHHVYLNTPGNWDPRRTEFSTNKPTMSSL